MALDYGEYEYDPMEGSEDPAKAGSYGSKAAAPPPGPVPAAPEDQTSGTLDMTTDDISQGFYPPRLPRPLPPPVPFPRTVSPLVELLRRQGGY